MVHPWASNDRKLSNSGHICFFLFFFKLECGELEWSDEREYGVIHFGKSQLSYSIPEGMLRLIKFEKIVPKMGKMKVKWEDFRSYQCSKNEKPLINPKDCQKYL